MIAHAHPRPLRRRRLAAFGALALLALLFWLVPARAHEGHDDHEEAPVPTQAASTLHRFSAASGDVELVGVLAGRQLTLYLDRAATNEPVREGTVALDVAGQTLTARPTSEGTFVATLARTLPEGSTPVVATVVVGGAPSRLAAHIDIQAEAGGHDEHPHGHAPNGRRLVAWGLLIVLAIGAIALLWQRHARQAARTGGAA